MYRFLMLIICLMTGNIVAYAVADPCKEQQCVAIIDAGSSGSRLFVYSYDVDNTNTPIQIKEIWSKKVKPGISNIEPNQASIDAYLTMLLSGAPTRNVAVYFYATAGMRLLPPKTQKIYYQTVQHWFAQQSQWQLVESKTITGTEEALYDWLAVNYTLGTLHSAQTKSVGVMDMGGASVQIVFPTHASQSTNDQSNTSLDIYGQHINLSVHSFLGLGQTQMSHQFLNASSCFANEFPLPDGELGHGNAQICEKQVASLMNAVHGINDVIQPLLAANPVDSWYTMGGISNLVDSSVFEFKDFQFSNQEMLQQADNTVCQQPWDDINNKYPGNDFIYQYCLLSAYYYALMVDGYGIGSNQNINYLPPNQSISWAIGVVLHRSSTINKSRPRLQMSGTVK